MSPKAISVLLRLMGSFYIQDKKYNDVDVFRFKQAAIDSGRVASKSVDVFSRFIKTAVVHCLKNYFRKLKVFSARVITLKNRVLMNLARSAFKALRLRHQRGLCEVRIT